jgi:hypothetical protein
MRHGHAAVVQEPFLAPRVRIYVAGADFLLCKGVAALLEAKARERGPR